jgi:hypothetical protein
MSPRLRLARLFPIIRTPPLFSFDGLPPAANRTHHSMNIVMTVWRRSKENFVAKASG